MPCGTGVGPLPPSWQPAHTRCHAHDHETARQWSHTPSVLLSTPERLPHKATVKGLHSSLTLGVLAMRR